VRPYDYGFVGEMSVLMNAHPLIGPALAKLFMRVMFAPGALARPEMLADCFQLVIPALSTSSSFPRWGR